jgi:tRNA nucleotidyltransferase/poly(A) polymerase
MSSADRTGFTADITTAEGFCYPMTSDDVAQLMRRLAEGGIEVWLDGGWAVDALLGEQTRSHDDVDIVLRGSDLPRMLETLGKEGFRRTEGGRPFNFVCKTPRDGKLTYIRSSSTAPATVSMDRPQRMANRRCTRRAR